MSFDLDRRPLIVAIAGPNGAGKTTFYESHLRPAGLRFVNADRLARDVGIDVRAAAEVAERMRRELVRAKESFVFETVLSDPVGEKVAFLAEAVASGYTVLLCFIGISSPRRSSERVAMRVSQGGHDVPADRLKSRYPRTLRNLERAIETLPAVNVFDNDALQRPFRLVAEIRDGRCVSRCPPVPKWAARVLPKKVR